MTENTDTQSMAELDREPETREELDLGDQMFKVERNTLEDGQVRGRIINVGDAGETIAVRYMVLTTRETHTVRFDKPSAWTRSNRFVRLVEWCGYNSASSLQIVDEEVPLREVDDGWKLDFERLPGQGVIDQIEFYTGVVKGVLGSFLFTAGILIVGVFTGDLVIATDFDAFTSVIGFLVVAFILFLATMMFLWRPPDDDKDRVEWSEVVER